MTAAAAAPERTVALVVGIERYKAKSTTWDLNGPASDARRMTEWLIQKGVPASQIHLHLSPGDTTLMNGQPQAKPANREEVREALNVLHQEQGDLLLIFWGGHGVIDSDGNRRLLYANATEDDKQNLDLDDLLRTLRTTYFKGFPRQICIVDACANFVEHMRLAHRLPKEQLPGSAPLFPEPEQFVLLSARAGEAAQNLSREGTGQFSKALLELLPEQEWPLKMGPLADALKKRFKELRGRDETSQTPIYWWRKSGESDLEWDFNALDLLAASEEMNSIFGWKRRGEVELIAKPLVSEAALKKLYRQSLPRAGRFNDQATTMRHVLFELSDLNSQKGGAFPVPLLEFVERLALHAEQQHPAEAFSLRAWVDQAGPQVKVTEQEIQDLRDRLRSMIGDDSDPFHVLVEVIPDQLEPTRFSLATFTWSREQEFESVDLLPEDSGSLLPQDIEPLLVQLMQETLPYLLPEGTTEVVLELFLPRELLCWSVDQLKIRTGKLPMPVGIRHRVIVRWRDRALKKTWDLYWKRKWRRAQNGASLLPESIFWILTSEHYRSKELLTRLIGSDDPFCVGLAFSPPDIPETEDLLDTILDSGVPVAFWLRQAWANPDELRQEIEQICGGKRVSDLPEVVREARHNAFRGEDGMHVGHHLTLLWDDADRRLPGFSQPPFARPRVG